MPKPTIDTLIGRKKLRRKVEGIAAALLPFDADGKIAVEAFQQHLVATHRAGLMNAVNMDTGYVNLLTQAEKTQVLRWTRECLGRNAPFVAGAFIEDEAGEPIALYRKRMRRDRVRRCNPDFVSECAPEREVTCGKSGDLQDRERRL